MNDHSLLAALLEFLNLSKSLSSNSYPQFLTMGFWGFGVLGFWGKFGGGKNWLMAKWGIGKRNHWCGIEKEEYEGQVELSKQGWTHLSKFKAG